MLDNLQNNMTPKQLAEVLPILRKLQELMQHNPNLRHQARDILKQLEEDRC